MKYQHAFFSVVAVVSLATLPFAQGTPDVPPIPSLQEVRGDIQEIREVSLEQRRIALPEFRPGELIVRERGAERFRRVTLPESRSVTEALRQYRARPDILYAEPNYVARAFYTPNDDYYPFQWHLDNDTSGGIDTEEAWDIERGAGVTVAVVDTGVAYEDYREGFFRRYYQAPDLADTAFVAGYDFVNNDTHANDDNGHGTHVAGTIAQSTNNDLGVAGVAFNATLMPIKVLDSRGSGSYADVADGIRWAADNGADVINLSLGGSQPATYLEEALAYAYNKGVTIVAAAGNNGSSSVSYPAAYDDYVIAVGATRFDETRTGYSNYGASLDLVAPGGDTSVDQNGDGYGDGVLQQTFGRRLNDWGYYFYEGTSMAAPHVAGAAALLFANGNAATPDEVRGALQETAKDLGPAGRDNGYGYGLINARAALQWSAGPVDNPPSVAITAPADGDTLAGTVTLSADASDDNGVDRVEFHADGSLIASDTTAPFETNWDSTSIADGSYTLKATAFDSIDQTAEDTIAITVDNVNDGPTAEAGADQTVADADGNDTEQVTLNGSGSSDPDGTITSYEWTEGATALGSGETLTVDLAVGTHTITLTVTDDDGATDSDDAVITVAENQAPSADAGPDQSVTVNEAVTFDGAGSQDPDGSITAYDWDFGDGTTATGETASHSYGSTGDYTVTLTVTDNGGKTAQDSAAITPADAPAQPTMHVGDITLSVQDRIFTWCRVRGSVLVLDTADKGVGSASAAVQWSGSYSRSESASTNGNGIASFTTRWSQCGTFTLTVDNVTKSDWLYDDSANVETSENISP